LAKIYAGVGSFASNIESPEQPVIFEINQAEWDANEKNVADIDHLSYFDGAEGEILFAPTYAFYPTKVEYDESDAVWNVILCRFTEFYDLRYEFLGYLIKLDVLLRTILEEESSMDSLSTDQVELNGCCETIVNDIASLVHELKFDEDDIVTLNATSSDDSHVNVSQFELKALRLFANSPLPRIRPVISSPTISMLYDCLATLFKCIGKYELAIENYNKAANYVENENSINSIMRQVKLTCNHAH
jgi:hypothetical protein